jgi:hypothetical protein
MKRDGRAQGWQVVDGRRDQLDRLSVAGGAHLLRLRVVRTVGSDGASPAL